MDLAALQAYGKTHAPKRAKAKKLKDNVLIYIEDSEKFLGETADSQMLMGLYFLSVKKPAKAAGAIRKAIKRAPNRKAELQRLLERTGKKVGQ